MKDNPDRRHNATGSAVGKHDRLTSAAKKHLKYICAHKARNGGAPLRGRWKGKDTPDFPALQWLRNTSSKLRDAKTTLRRAALVSLGYLEPNGDEWRIFDRLPDFLRNMPRPPDITVYKESEILLTPRHGLFFLDPD